MSKTYELHIAVTIVEGTPDIEDALHAAQSALADELDEQGVDYRMGALYAKTRRRKASDDPTKNQLGGFHKGGPETERNAALDNYPRSGSQKEKILLALRDDLERATADEMRDHTGLRFNTTAARLHDLKEEGWLDIVGEKPSESGSLCSIFALSDQARTWFSQRKVLA